MRARQGKVLGFNGQAVVDDDSDMIVACDVVNDLNDSQLLTPMLEQVRENVGQVADENLADSGYETREQLARAEEAQIEVLVPAVPPAQVGPYSKDKFVYDEMQDEYHCPQGRRLPLAAILKPTTNNEYFSGCYRCDPTGCPAHKACTSCETGRTITRNEYERARDRQEQKRRQPGNRERMRLRKGMIERVFGQIKGNDGFRRFLRKGLESVNAEWALMCTAFNLRKMHALWAEGLLTLAG